MPLDVEKNFDSAREIYGKYEGAWGVCGHLPFTCPSLSFPLLRAS